MRTRDVSINPWRVALATAATLVLSAALFGGCNSSSGDSAIHGVSSGAAEQLNAEHSIFESSEDPPLNADTHFAAGQLAETQGDPVHAIAQYQAALKLQPNHRNALYRMAMLYAERKQFPQAIETWKRYVSADHDSADAYNNLALCCQMAGKNADAKSAFEKGIARDPKNQRCRVNYGLLLAREGWLVQATDQLSAVLPPAEVHYNLGSVYQQQGRREDARREFSRALELDPALADAQKRLSMLE